MAKELLTDGHAVVGALSTKHGLALRELSEVFAASEFTDDGGAAGHVDFEGSLPAGAMVIGGCVVVTRGMIGDTTAVMTVGDGTTVDRYNAATIDVFTAIAGIDLGLPTGPRYHEVAKTPRLTVTGGSNFTSILNGSPNGNITVKLWYTTPEDVV